MKLIKLVPVITMIPFLAFAQTEPSMLGIWKGVSNSAVYGGGHFHPKEDNMEESIRFRNVEYIMTIVKADEITTL